MNLFLPLREEKKLGVFLNYLKMASSGDPQSEFEKKSSIEKAARLTSFDFYLKSNASEVYIEVKYTEDGFGRAENDDEHRENFKLTYLPLLRDSRYLARACHSETEFLKHFQILRNLVHIGDTAWVVLLFPAGNKRVAEEAAYAREHFLTDAGRDRLKIVHIEELLTYIDASFSGTPLDGYYRKFGEKYLA